MEKIMSKTNDTSRDQLTINDLNRELRELSPTLGDGRGQAAAA